MNTELKNAVKAADLKAQYDARVKRLVGHKRILAQILIKTVDEFKGMNPKAVAGCIEGTPYISAIPVEPGLTNAVLDRNGQRIVGFNTENQEINEGLARFDIVFYVRTKDGLSQIIINVEAQKSFYPGYHIETRGIFYAARMLSAQLGTEFAIPNYQNLKKVYSIWICMNAPNYIGNAISEYKIAKEDIISGIPDNVEAYDKLSVIMICLNQKKEDQTNDSFLKMMNLLLNSHISAKEKKKILQTDYHIPMTIRLGEELNFMCNLSDLLEEEVLNRKETEIVLKMIAQGLSDETIMECVTISKERLMQIKNSQNLNTK